MMRPLFLCLGLSAVALAACTQEIMPTPAEGRALFQDNCAVCHGETGQGDGPLADQNISVPADLTRLAADNGGVFPREHVLSTVDGYTRGALEVPGMPEFGKLFEGDLVPFDTGDGNDKLTPTPRKLVALVEYLETLQAPAAEG